MNTRLYVIAATMSACAAPPGPMTVAITPEAPGTLDDLVLEIVSPSVDPNDDLVGLSVRWLLGGVAHSEFDHSDYIPASQTRKGEQWSVRVVPVDEKDLEGPAAEAATTVLNTPPVVTVQATPETPSTLDDLEITVATSDADDDVVVTRTTWRLDANPAPEFDDFYRIPADGTARGQVWTAEVWGEDDEELAPMVETVFLIENSPPTVLEVSLTPELPLVDDTLTATMLGADADGDMVEVAWSWWVNDVEVTGQTSAELTSEHWQKGDEVHALATPSDGMTKGEAVASPTRTVGNSTPGITGVGVEPAAGTEATTFTCVPTGWYDLDASDTEGYEFAWLVDGAVVTTTSTLDGVWFDKGDVVACVATPTDGDDPGVPWTSDALVVANTPATAQLVSLLPLAPVEGDVVTPGVGGWYDPDPADVEGYLYSWVVDGQPAGSTPTLDSAFFNKSQSISVSVRPYDGEDAGVPLESNIVIAVNTPPVVQSVTINPTEPMTGDSLTALPVGWSDPDPADSPSYLYEWTVGGVVVPGSTTDALPSSATARGDSVRVTATPIDAEAFGAPVVSADLEVVNSPPSAPVVQVSPEDPIEGQDDLSCTVVTASSDADSDSVTYSFAWAVDGVAFAGLATDAAQESTIAGGETNGAEVWTCEAVASDGLASSAVASDGVFVSPAGFVSATAEHRSGDAGLAVDDDPSTCYQSQADFQADSEQWWMGDLGTIRTVEGVEFLWLATGNLKTVEVLGATSPDFSSGTVTLYSGTFTPTGSYVVSEISASVRYVQLTLTGSSHGGQGLDLCDFRVLPE